MTLRLTTPPLLLGAVLCAACGARDPIVLTPGGVQPIDWSPEELGADVAVRTLRQTDAASFHLVRLRGAERPHVHDRSDMTVLVLGGRVRMHLADQVVELRRGDVVDIPLGTPHWAENLSGEGSLAYVVYTPPFDGKDRRFLD